MYGKEKDFDWDIKDLFEGFNLESPDKTEENHVKPQNFQ